MSALCSVLYSLNGVKLLQINWIGAFKKKKKSPPRSKRESMFLEQCQLFSGTKVLTVLLKSSDSVSVLPPRPQQAAPDSFS